MVSSISNNSALRLQNMLKAANATDGAASGVGAKGGAKAPKIDANQAEELIKEFLNLSPQQKVEARPILADLFKNDKFSLDDGARTKFAHALGLPKSDITPAQVDTSRIGGTTQQSSVRELAMDMLKQIPKFDGKRMKNFLDGAKEFMPKEGQEFLAAALGGMSKDGSVKMDPKARKDFVKWTGALNQKGGVTEHKEVMDAPRTEGTSALAKAMAGAQTFEQLVAAFMMHICGDIQDKTTDKIKEADQANQADHKKAVLSKASEFAGGPLNQIPPAQQDQFITHVAQAMGSDKQDVASILKPHLSAAGGAGAASGAGAAAESPLQKVSEAANDLAEQFGFGSVEKVPPQEREPFMKMVAEKPQVPLETVRKEFGAEPASGATGAEKPTENPASSTGAKVPMGPQAFSNYVSKTKTTLQAAVQSTHAQFNDVEKKGAFAGKTGIITKFEAEKITSKLEGLKPPVAAVIANSMMNGMLNSTVDLDGPAKPIADWAAKQLGGWDNVDLDQVMSGHPISKGSGKLEQDIAGFIVGALEESGKTIKLGRDSAPEDLQEGIDKLKDKMGVLNSFADQMETNPMAQQAFDQLKTNVVDPKSGDATAVSPPAGGAPPTGPSAPPSAGGPSAADAAGPATDAAAPAAAPKLKSSMQLFEELKNLQQELMQLMQAMSNVLNMMKENAMNAIRSIR
ncbi:MAG: hypothetical protein GY822_20270 [Deltaproteobacteria bacterium]|nr:hypothetical protein [Deltaproteobacteria bacterium]